MNKREKLAHKKKRSRLGAMLTWIVAIAFLVAAVYGMGAEREKLTRLLKVNVYHTALLVGACLLLFIPSGLTRKLMARRLGIHLVFLDWFGLLIVSNFINLFVPARGDLVLSSAYLWKKYGMPITRFGSMIYGNMVLVAAVLSMEGCLTLLVLGFMERLWSIEVWAIVTIMGVGSMFLAFFPSRLLRGENFIVARLRAGLEGWEILRSDLALMARLIVLVMWGSAVFAVWMYLSYVALGFEVRIVPVVFASVAIQMSFFFSITPGNLGVREMLLGFVSQVIGLGFGEGIAVTILQRAVSVVVFLVVGGFFSILVLRSLSKGELDKRAEESSQDVAAN
jgi:uncharacterized membrane protein YbhN (UPF0104 family)